MGGLTSVVATLGTGSTINDALFGILDEALINARVRFILPDRTYEVGTGEDFAFVVRVSDPQFARRVLTSGNLGLAESYMEGQWTMERGTLDRFLSTLALADVDTLIRRDPRLVARIAAMRIGHALINSTKRVRPHYDLAAEVYELFLDETMGYSCGYQKTPDDSLQTMQENKYDLVCQKLQVREGERFLDIGCGWGGLVIHAARYYGARAHGISPAPNQVEKLRARARQLGLESRVTADTADFREVTGQFDKIASIGMFEHLYPREHAAYFSRIRSVLAPDGIGLVHFMGCTTDKNDPDPFIQTYIYPGSTQPQLSLAVKALEREKLAILDVHNIARHYLPSSQCWSDRFHANKHRLDPAKYDARFIRMFEYLMAIYVAGSSLPVAGVFQVLFTNNYHKNLPWHRV